MAKKISTSAAKKTIKTFAAAGKKPASKPTTAKKTAAKGSVRTSGMTARRADLGSGVGAYFAKQTGKHRTIAERLHDLIVQHVPKATHAVKWGMPVYEHHGMLCYIRVRPAYVTLGFYAQGTRLNDPKGLLDGSGENMRHAKLALDAPFPEKDLIVFIKQAVRLNEQDA